MKHRTTWLLFVTTIALALVTSHFLLAKASPVSTSPSSQQRKGLYRNLQDSPQLANAAAAQNVTYHGGVVMSGVTQTYAIFWEPTGTQVTPNYNSLILRYLNDIGTSQLYHNLVQYTDSKGGTPSGSALGGSYVDTQTAYQYVNNVITGVQIQQEVQHALQVNGWTPAPNKLFMVFTSQSINNDSGTAYHGSFTANNTTVIYSTVPDIFPSFPVFTGASPNQDVYADSSILVTSHEQMEAASDPLNAWFDAQNYEIGDKCEAFFGTKNADGSNLVLNGHPYVTQGEWDNKIQACTLAGP